MKKLLIFFIPLLISSCNSSTESELDLTIYRIKAASDSSIQAEVKKKYLEDACRLSVREIDQKIPPGQQQVEIPEASVMMYYNGLIHIYNYAKHNNPCDSVINIFPIHTFKNPVLNKFVLGISDTSKSWVKRLINGETGTGNKEFDELINKYEISVRRKYVSYPLVFYLESAGNINVKALCSLFSKITGVKYSEPNSYMGDGDDIYATAVSGKIKYSFKLGWGDCPAGCTEIHIWEFEVNLQGEVTFLRSYGKNVYSSNF